MALSDESDSFVADVIDLIERAYRLGWNDCLAALEGAADDIKRDAGAQYRTRDLLREVRSTVS